MIRELRRFNARLMSRICIICRRMCLAAVSDVLVSLNRRFRLARRIEERQLADHGGYAVTHRFHCNLNLQFGTGLSASGFNARQGDQLLKHR